VLINFANEREQLRAKYPNQPWGAVAGYAAKPFKLSIRRAEADLCKQCQEFGSGLLFDPGAIPLLPLRVCECDHACGCTYA
jgi:hypothetical protein